MLDGIKFSYTDSFAFNERPGGLDALKMHVKAVDFALQNFYGPLVH